MPDMKQGTLSFASTKRTHSIPKGKSQQGAQVTRKAKSKRVETSAEDESHARASEVHEISSDDEGAAVAQIFVPAKRTRASTKKRASLGAAKQAPTQLLPPEKQRSPEIERDHLDVNDKAGRYQGYYNEVRSKMGYVCPIHSEGQNRIHQMLRFFDMSYEFGPCIGMTRLERWERAEAFGLNPPVEVRDILLTKEGIEKPEYTRCVLDTEV